MTTTREGRSVTYRMDLDGGLHRIGVPATEQNREILWGKILVHFNRHPSPPGSCICVRYGGVGIIKTLA
jgi:hypothetical protein